MSSNTQLGGSMMMDFGGTVAPLTSVKCPSCGKFSSNGWLGTSTSPDGHIYIIGGECKTHGEWGDYAEMTGWFRE